MKISILSFILLIPAVIYIFLKIFGQNEFDLPYYSSDGLTEQISGEALTDNQMLSMDLSGLLFDAGGSTAAPESIGSKIIILNISDNQETSPQQDYPVRRISDIFRSYPEVHILHVINTVNAPLDRVNSGLEEFGMNVWTGYLNNDEIRKIVPSFIWDGTDVQEQRIRNVFILLDRQRRIRGYYPGYDFEEIDRLILEVKVLLKGGEHV